MPTTQILVVEDEQIVAADIQGRLNKLGFVTHVAYSGEEAIAKASELNPDIVLMDIVLPGEIDGIEAAKRIREINHLPVVFLTAYSDKQTLYRAREAEPFGYLLKPLKDRELVSTIEITLRKHELEARLFESEDRYRDLIENSQDLICTHDLDGLILSMNRAFAKMLGVEPDDCIRKTNIRDILTTETQEQFGEYLERIQADGEAKGVMAVRNGAGERRILEYNNTLRTEDLDKPIVRAMGLDITERIKTENALRQAEEKYRSIFENSPDGMLQVLPSGRIITANPAAARMLGYESVEDTLANVTDIGAQHYVRPESRTELLEQYTLHDNIDSIEIELYKKDRKKIWISTGGRVVRDAKGEVLYYESVIRDITERKHLEERLRQAQRLEAVGKLAGGIAHDFNNLLTVILGYSEMSLPELRKEDPLHDRIVQIQQAAQRASTLTGQLLAFSRKQVLQPQFLDLNHVVSEMDKMLHRLIGEDIRLTTWLDHDLGGIKADPGQIEQVILNLAINARDAMPKGGSLTIETSNTNLDGDYAREHLDATAGAYVVLSISDTGCGIDPETKRQIFEPFFTTKPLGEGTGLGLSTVYGIVKQSNGSVEVYSEVGRGTTFKVYLPRADKVARKVEPTVMPAEPARGTETILLTEDDESVRKLAKNILSQQGYEVLEAANGGSALLICERYQGHIDLLLTDVIMPELGGRELSDRLAILRPNMRVLFMSGYTSNAIIHHEVLSGSSQFIQKPFSPVILANKVREVLDKPVIHPQGSPVTVVDNIGKN